VGSMLVACKAGAGSAELPAMLQGTLGLIARLFLHTIPVNSPPVSISALDAAGQPRLEMNLRKATKSALLGSIISTSKASAELPSTDFLSGASVGGRRLLSLSQAAFQTRLEYLAPSVNPYAAPPALMSGVVRVSVETDSGIPVSISGLGDAESIYVGLALTEPSSSPQCVYRTSAEDWSPSGINTRDATKGPLVAEFRTSPIGEQLYCRSSHLTDFAVIESCAAATVCSGHGICNYDGSCHCTCGYYSSDCSEVHMASWSTPSKNRYVSNAAGARLPIGNNATGGYISLLPYSGGNFSCAGSGAAPVSSYASGVGTRLPVSWDSTDNTGVAYLPAEPSSPLEAGRYQMCFCNAEKRNDPTYSNCNTDCAFHTSGDVVTLIDMPRLGPSADPGSARVVRGIPGTFRVRGGNTANNSVQVTDHLFLAPSCADGPSGSSSATRTPDVALIALNTTERSVVFTVPTTFDTANHTATQLKLCFAPLEMGPTPALVDYTELPDTLSIIPPPLFNNGSTGRMITGSAPEFEITGDGDDVRLVDGGDQVFFAASCSSVPSASSSATAPITVSEYDNEGGPLCSSETALNVGVPAYSSPFSSQECGFVAEGGPHRRPSSAALHSSQAWCSTERPMALERLERSFPNKYQERLSGTFGPYLEVDTGAVQLIGTIRSQGRADQEQWVTLFALAFSEDGVNWVDHKNNSTLRLYAANFDPSTVVNNDVFGTVTARYVRVYPMSWRNAIAMRVGVAVCHIGHKVALPTTPPLTATAELGVCFGTRRSERASADEYTELAHSLVVVAQAQSTAIYVKHAEITQLSLAGNGVAKAGDMVVVQREGCEEVLSTSEAFPAGPTPVMTLEGGGKVSLEAVLNARLNELQVGSYWLCLATAESKGDDEADYHALLGRFVVEGDRVTPTMVVPRTIPMGQDIHVHWSAGSGRTSHAQDWIGLYHSGDCDQLQLAVGEAFPSTPALDSTAPLNQNRCFIASEQLDAGESAGTLRFSAHHYGMAHGTFEVRYFLGDSRDGQGMVCRRLQGSPSELYKYCALEYAAVSDAIRVLSSLADGGYEYDLAEDKMPGLDIVIDNGAWQMG